jgi:hypothetical protein
MLAKAKNLMTTALGFPISTKAKILKASKHPKPLKALIAENKQVVR